MPLVAAQQICIYSSRATAILSWMQLGSANAACWLVPVWQRINSTLLSLRGPCQSPQAVSQGKLPQQGKLLILICNCSSTGLMTIDTW